MKVIQKMSKYLWEQTAYKYTQNCFLYIFQEFCLYFKTFSIVLCSFLWLICLFGGLKKSHLKLLENSTSKTLNSIFWKTLTLQKNFKSYPCFLACVDKAGDYCKSHKKNGKCEATDDAWKSYMKRNCFKSCFCQIE